MRNLSRCLLSLLLFCASLSAQTLARPGWAGSGLGGEAWWRAAVLYRVDVAHFQDSDGDGAGDLTGLAQRMDYVQSLGVDAVVLLAGFDETGFDALLHEASGRRIRVVVGLSADADRKQLVARSRQWFTRGAAGVYLQGSAGADAGELLRELRALAESFPGQRVVLSQFAAPLSLRKGAHGAAPQLADVQIVSGADVLEREMTDAEASTESAPLLLTDARFRSANAFYAEDPAQQLGMNKILATVLLSFRGAVSLRYGQELGLAAEAGGDAPETMQWTPGNVTPKPAVAEAPKPAADPNVFGAYVPYVKPKAQPKPGDAAVMDPDSLRGFTSGELRESGGKTNRAVANVALEDADAASLLNYYRRLVALHHGNSSIRSGAPHILHAGGGGELALLWVRRAPVGARTAANVVVACNLGETPLRVSVDADLTRLRIGAGTLRPLLASWTETPGAQNTGAITLPPYSVFVGELFRGGR